MLKQIKALGLVLVIGGMLVGCEAPEEVKNIDLQGAVDNVEAFVDEKINKDEEVQEALLLMADDLLNQVDFVQAYMNDNKGMDINEYANYVANKGVEAAMAAMEQEGIAVNIEDVQVLVGQYMYEAVYNELQQNEYKINQGMINNKFEELEREQQNLVPVEEPVVEEEVIEEEPVVEEEVIMIDCFGCGAQEEQHEAYLYNGDLYCAKCRDNMHKAMMGN